MAEQKTVIFYKCYLIFFQIKWKPKQSPYFKGTFEGAQEENDFQNEQQRIVSEEVKCAFQ